MSEDARDSSSGESQEVPTEVRTEYDWAETPPSVAVVEALAACKDATPMTLATDEGIHLYEYVDFDALDTLLPADHDTQLTIAFTIDGYSIRLTGRELRITAPEKR